MWFRNNHITTISRIKSSNSLFLKAKCPPPVSQHSDLTEPNRETGRTLLMYTGHLSRNSTSTYVNAMWQQKSKTFNKTYPKPSNICLYLRISKKRYGDITILSTALFVQCQTASKPLFLPLKLHEWRFFPNQPCTVQVTIERCQCLKTGFTQI